MLCSISTPGPLQTCQAAWPYMERRGGGAIINVGSIAGLDGGGSGTGIYGASKAFVHNLTRHLAREFAAQNIRVNTVSPGVVDTAFHSATPPRAHGGDAQVRLHGTDRHAGRLRRRVPVPCISGTLSGYVTGQNIHVNGGQVMP